MKGKSLQEDPNIATNGSYTQDCKTSRVKTKTDGSKLRTSQR